MIKMIKLVGMIGSVQRNLIRMEQNDWFGSDMYMDQVMKYQNLVAIFATHVLHKDIEYCDLSDEETAEVYLVLQPLLDEWFATH